MLPPSESSSSVSSSSTSSSSSSSSSDSSSRSSSSSESTSILSSRRSKAQTQQESRDEFMASLSEPQRVLFLKYKKSDAFRGLLDRLWNAFTFHTHDVKRQSISQQEYEDTFLVMFKSLHKEFDQESAAKLVAEEWTRDSGAKNYMSKNDFVASIQELVISWVPKATMDESIQFLSSLFRSSTKVIPSLKGYRHRWLSLDEVEPGSGLHHQQRKRSHPHRQRRKSRVSGRLAKVAKAARAARRISAIKSKLPHIRKRQVSPQASARRLSAILKAFTSARNLALKTVDSASSSDSNDGSGSGKEHPGLTNQTEEIAVGGDFSLKDALDEINESEAEGGDELSLSASPRQRLLQLSQRTSGVVDEAEKLELESEIGTRQHSRTGRMTSDAYLFHPSRIIASDQWPTQGFGFTARTDFFEKTELPLPGDAGVEFTYIDHHQMKERPRNVQLHLLNLQSKQLPNALHLQHEKPRLALRRLKRDLDKADWNVSDIFGSIGSEIIEDDGPYKPLPVQMTHSNLVSISGKHKGVGHAAREVRRKWERSGLPRLLRPEPRSDAVISSIRTQIRLNRIQRSGFKRRWL